MTPELGTLVYGYIQILDVRYGIFKVIEYSTHGSLRVKFLYPETFGEYFMPISFILKDFETSDIDTVKTQFPEYFI